MKAPGGRKGEAVTDTAIVISNRLPHAHTPTVTPGRPCRRRRRSTTRCSCPWSTARISTTRRCYRRETDDEEIAVVVLHHWSFTPSAGGDFEQAMQEIRLRPNGGVLRFGNLPVNSGEDPKLSDAARSSGFPNILLAHSQPGDDGYRGPLRPFEPPDRSKGFAVRAEPQELRRCSGPRLLACRGVRDRSPAGAARRGPARRPARRPQDDRRSRPRTRSTSCRSRCRRRIGSQTSTTGASRGDIDDQSSLIKEQTELHKAYGAADALGAKAIENLAEKELDTLKDMGTAQLDPVVSIDLPHRTERSSRHVWSMASASSRSGQ